MPNRNTHLLVGVTAGVGAGILATRGMPTEQRAFEIAFAAIGGLVGGAMPDILEPATTPNHRAEFHSLVMGGAIGAAAAARWQAACRHKADLCDGRAILLALGSPDRTREETAAFFWRALSGFLVGFLAGYASHLGLDFMTKRALPLITDGF